MIHVIENKGVFLSIAAVLVFLSIVFLSVFGLRPGIELSGGSEIEVEILNADGSFVSEAEVSAALERFGFSLRQVSQSVFEFRTAGMSSEEKELFIQSLRTGFDQVSERSFSSIGPVIGAELKSQAVLAVIFVIVGISLYIAFAFRKASARISSWKYGIVTFLTLAHDVLIPAGVIALLGYFLGIEVDTNFIVALLVVMGFSVHDTIVVFDRVRENIVSLKQRNATLLEIINYSVNETFARSINTSLTLVFVLVALLLFGPESLFYFILTILIGTVVGTYSSIFVASPLLYMWSKGSR